MDSAQPAPHIDSAGSPPLVSITRCSGCGRCVAACSLRLMTLETSGYRKHALLTDASRCTGCGCCSAACPVDAVTTVKGFLP